MHWLTPKVYVIALAVLASCQAPPVAPTPPSHSPVVPPSLPPATPTPPTTAVPAPGPVAILSQAATLFDGPGNIGYSSLAEISQGTSVYVIGQYVDFVKVAVPSEAGQALGYVWKAALQQLPPAIPSLGLQDVPWEPIYDPTCSPGTYDPQTGTLTLKNDGNSLFSAESFPFPLRAPLQIIIDGLSITGRTSDLSSVSIVGTISETSPLWEGRTRLSIAYDSGYYRLDVWDGASDEPADTYWLVDPKQPIRIRFEQLTGTSFTVYGEDGLEQLHVDLVANPAFQLPDGLFPDGNIRIGTTLAPRSKFVIRGLRLQILPDGRWQDGAIDDAGLAELAARQDVTIGTSFDMWNMFDMRYCRAMHHHFNVAILGDFSWPGMWLAPGEYDFRSLDPAITYARLHGWTVRASHLVWGAPEAIPSWLAEGDFTREEYIALLEDHVKTVVAHYRGRVQEWIIANEAIEREPDRGADFWGDKIGPEYIEMAFRWASEVDPSATLIFNGNFNDSPRDAYHADNIERTLAMLEQLKGQGVPIDVVGMQMHLFLPYMNMAAPDKDDVIDTIRQLAAFGVQVYITEMDVDLARIRGSQAERLEFQARVYRDIIEACLQSGVCTSFATWGISDSASWLTCEYLWCLGEANAAPLMFDASFHPKPAFFAVREALAR